MEGFRWIIGNGSTILFWEDHWWGDCALVESFPRIYNLSICKSYSIKDFLDKWNSTFENVMQRWRRPLRAWEEEYVQMLQSIIDLVKFTNAEDKLVWLNSSKQFSVKDCYESLLPLSNSRFG